MAVSEHGDEQDHVQWWREAANAEHRIAKAVEAERDRYREALKVLRNPDPAEYEANAYVRRMATFARNALESVDGEAGHDAG